MADNLQVTEGSGTTIATDDVGGVQYQRVKRARGTDGKVTSDVKFALIQASSPSNTLISAVTGKKIRVLAYVLSASNAVNAKFLSGATDITGLIYMDAKGGVAATSDDGLFETASGEALMLSLSAGYAVGGHIAYVEEAA